MANVIPEDSDRIVDPNDINAQIREYILIKKSTSTMEARAKELREKIFEYIDIDGEEDDAGSYNVYLDSDIDGVLRIQKTRRAKRVLDETAAEAIIEEAGIGDDVYEMKRVINEDYLMAAFYQEKITEEQLDAMFPTTVVWALNTLKK
jgi:hypothetical protein